MEAENIFSLITSIVACISAICNLCIALKNTKKITASLKCRLFFVIIIRANRLLMAAPFFHGYSTICDKICQRKLFGHI